jgi:hypothetical protein
VPAGCDIRWLDADTVGGRDLADRPAGILGLEELFRLAPDAVAVPVELQGRDALDGLAFALLAD